MPDVCFLYAQVTLLFKILIYFSLLIKIKIKYDSTNKMDVEIWYMDISNLFVTRKYILAFFRKFDSVFPKKQSTEKK